MAVISVRLLGKFSAYSGSQPLPGLEARKLQEFLAYLLLHRNRTFNREALAELMAPEAAPVQSRKSLRQALWQLQTVLNETASSPEERLILADAEWITVNGSADVWLDVAEIDAAFARTVGQPGEMLDEEVAGVLCRAVSLYRGDLLEGWYQDWCLLERERLQSSYLALLDKLMVYHQAHAEYERALVYGSTVLRYDRARERTHFRLMQLHWLAGDRTAALRQFRACAEALREELDAEPSRRTLALYREILRDAPAHLAGLAATQPVNGSAAPAAGPVAQGANGAPCDPLIEEATSFFAEIIHLQDQLTRQLSELQHLLSFGS